MASVIVEQKDMGKDNDKKWELEMSERILSSSGKVSGLGYNGGSMGRSDGERRCIIVRV